MNWWNSRGYWDTIVGKINESPRYAIQPNKSTDVDKKATMLVSMSYIFRRLCMRICCGHFCCQPIPQPQNYLSLWNYISGKLNWSFCVGLCTQWLPWLDGLLVSLLWVKELTFKHESIHTVIHREMLASWKVSPKCNNVCRMWLNDQLHHSACP